jgi:hypothetical protein
MYRFAGWEDHDAAKGLGVIPEEDSLGREYLVFRPYVVPNPKVPSLPSAVPLRRLIFPHQLPLCTFLKG